MPIPASPTKSPNATKKPTTRRQSVTPKQKDTSAKMNTPKSAEQTQKKKAEPTLLQDFLLGRPSPSRQQQARRKSLTGVKVEMKSAIVDKAPAAGGVKDRVSQWQKVSATPVKVPGLSYTGLTYSMERPILQVVDSPSMIKPIPSHARHRSVPATPIQRNLKENTTPKKDPIPVKPRQTAKSPVHGVATPKKRVVSDSHWKTKAESSPKKMQERNKTTLPRNFVAKYQSTPPLSTKIGKWAEGVEPTPRRSSLSSIGARSEEEEEVDVMKAKAPLRSTEQVENRKSDSAKRSSATNGTRLTPPRAAERRTSRPLGHQRSVSDGAALRNRRKVSAESSERSVSPTIDESLADVPVGYSAFSVLELPDDKHNRTFPRPAPKPQRAPSFGGIPNMFRKVREIISEAQEPPRVGINQPPSIESWLKGTADPFVDDSTNELPPMRPKTFVKSESSVLQDETEITPTRKNHANIPKQKSDVTKNYEVMDMEMENRPQKKAEDSPVAKARAIFEASPPVSPSSNGLKRKPVPKYGDYTSSPTTPQRSPLRERFVDAIKKEPVNNRNSMFADMRINHDHPPRTSSRKEDLILQPQDDSARVDLQARQQSRNIDDLKQSSPFPDRSSSIPDTKRPLSALYPVGETIVKRDPPQSPHRAASSVGTTLTDYTDSFYTETETAVSEATVTQSISQPSLITSGKQSASGLSRGRSAKLHNKSNNGIPQRRLTKHSDLMSVLSLPGDGEGKPIRSARSLRTTRKGVGEASMDDLLYELASDEAKYCRELETLVDGVIPVLLTSVLSKSPAAVQAGFFDGHSAGESNSTLTKPIVDMGIALEKLKSLHKWMPPKDPNKLIIWALGAHKVYDEYLMAWRTGFKNVFINLAPISLKVASAEIQTQDEVDAASDRVEVAFLLKRPLVRIRHLAKLTKGLDTLSPTPETVRLSDMYAELLAKTKRRAKEEEARQEDMAANHSDTSRARDLCTLAPTTISINQKRQVNMKDYFTLRLQHSNGQQIDCRIELIYRDRPKQDGDPGDIMICEVDSESRWLLFAPIEMKDVSAQPGTSTTELQVMVRGIRNGCDWSEIITLIADDVETAAEWLDVIGISSESPRAADDEYALQAKQASVLSRHESIQRWAQDIEVPIGETKCDSRLLPSHGDYVHDKPGYREKQDDVHVMSGGLGSTATSKHVTPDKAQRPAYNANKASPRQPSYEGSDWGQEVDTIVYETPTKKQSGSTIDNPTRGLAYGSNGTQDMPATTFEDIIQKPSSEVIKRKPIKQQDATKHTPTKQPPTPPTHKDLSPPKTPMFQAIANRFSRRSSSPLKHEYQPSLASDTSEVDDVSSDSEYTESSDSEHELDDQDTPMPAKKSPTASLYSLPNASLATSSLAAPVVPRNLSQQAPSMSEVRFIASISRWNMNKWENLRDEDCSVIVCAGMIEAFVIGTEPKRKNVDTETDLNDAEYDPQPLAALELTPLVTLRKSTVVDIEIRSPPCPRSLLKWNGSVRFRTHTTEDCMKLYNACHQARMSNPVYLRLEQERLINSYGGQTYQEVQEVKRNTGGLAFFGRKKSYRASGRAPSTQISDDKQSSQSYASAFINRVTSGGYNIAKSRIIASRAQSGAHSPFSTQTPSSGTSLRTDSASGYTSSPYSPVNGSIAESNGRAFDLNRDLRDINIRCYKQVGSSSWGGDVPAKLTISSIPPSVHAPSSQTIYKHITVTTASKSQPATPTATNPDGVKKENILLETMIANNNVRLMGRTGIAVNVWESVVDEEGRVGAIGGSSGRQRKWMFQFASQEEVGWIYACLGGL